MITTCTGCQTRYRLDDGRVPRRRIRVRCPRCEAVFALDGTQAAAQVAPVAPVAPVEAGLVIERSGGGLFSSPPTPAAAAETPRPVPRPVPRPQPFPTSAPAAAAPAGVFATARATTASVAAVAEPAAPTTDSEAPGDPGGRPRRDRDKARRLARALVSDILVYNRESRDRALTEGNLIQALGPEIKKSWELYKERVTPEVANSTSHFRDALNEILAEGQKVF
jgi:predicted Zn finger-like uncharacterized protein